LRFRIAMNEAGAKAASSEDGAEGVHRLRDIVVEEVSLVDRAANQRRFLVVKRSAEMADENTATEDGKSDTPNAIEKAKKKPAVAAGDETVDEAKAKKKPADGETEEDAETEKARGAAKDDDEDDDESEPTKKARKQDLVLAAPVKEALLRVLTDVLERLMALANTIKEAEEPEDGDGGEMPKEVTTELETVADMLYDANKRKQAKADVAKAGARMAKDRLDRFQKALSLLADILKELTGTIDAPPAPTAGAAETGVTKRAAAAPQPAAVPGLTDLVTGIGELTRVVKRQEEELSRMRQARGVSNAIPVEGGRRAEPQDVSWPLDMNRPISRDKVRKEVSFFDE
jgi:hypothetical protein